MSLDQKVTLGNTVHVEGNYRPSQARAPPSFNFRGVVGRFLRRWGGAPALGSSSFDDDTTTTINDAANKNGKEKQTPPPSPPLQRKHTPQSPPRQRPKSVVDTSSSPILQFRRTSICDVQGQVKEGGAGTKGGVDDADGVGLASGDGGGDMQGNGVVVRDFAEGMGCGGDEGVGSALQEEMHE